MGEFAKERMYGMVGAGGFHLLLILFLLYTYMNPYSGKQDNQALLGVPVKYGNVADAFGTDNPGGKGDGSSSAPDVDLSVPTPQPDPASGRPQPSTPATAPSATNVYTQNSTQTVAVKTDAEKRAEEKRRADAIEAENKRKAEAEAARVARAQADASRNINQSVGGAFGRGSGGGNSGNTSGSGNQGSPYGNSDSGATTGIGGVGTLVLPNRNAIGSGMVRPTYPNVNVGGTVVVNIIVDPKGNVVSATAGGRGTNTSNIALRAAAEAAAKRTKFNTINSPSNQSGTITYYFNLTTN